MFSNSLSSKSINYINPATASGICREVVKVNVCFVTVCLQQKWIISYKKHHKVSPLLHTPVCITSNQTRSMQAHEHKWQHLTQLAQTCMPGWTTRPSGSDQSQSSTRRYRLRQSSECFHDRSIITTWQNVRCCYYCSEERQKENRRCDGQRISVRHGSAVELLCCCVELILKHLHSVVVTMFSLANLEVSILLVPSIKSQWDFYIRFWMTAENKLCEKHSHILFTDEEHHFYDFWS